MSSPGVPLTVDVVTCGLLANILDNDSRYAMQIQTQTDVTITSRSSTTPPTIPPIILAKGNTD